jgi:2-methylfumaryl-CoA isomerase
LTAWQPGSTPRLGEHTDQVSAQVLGLPAAEIGRLHDSGIVAGPEGR